MIISSLVSIVRQTTNVFLQTGRSLFSTSTAAANAFSAIKPINLINFKNGQQQHQQALVQNKNFLPQLTQTRFNWGYKGRMMLKDIKRRELLKKFAPLRNRLQTIRANTVLPKVLKKAAEEQLQKLPRQSSINYVTNRCGFTSKAGGCLNRWRLSRIVWRDQVDYNHASGIMRAVWGVPSRNAVHFTFKRAQRNWFNYDGYRQVKFIDRQGTAQKMRFKLN